LRALGLDDSSGRQAAKIKEGAESGTNNVEIISGNTERSSGLCDLGDEIAHLSMGEIHEPETIRMAVALAGKETYLWTSYMLASPA
jgi:hypothetical protein